MDTTKLIPVAATLAICFALTKFVKQPAVVAGAYGVMGVVLAKNLPYVKTALA